MPSPSNGINRLTTRSSYHISRSGCRTCKRRKVRCDESEPSCRNCTSTGRICDGVNSNNKFVFVDNTLTDQAQSRRSRSSSPAVALTPPRRQDELRSFDVFFKAAAPLFANGSLDGAFWQEVVPAMSQHMQFAWNSTISIGLLYENPVYNIDSNLPLTRQLAPPQLKALRWYARAVTQSTKDFNQSADNPLLALLSCTLFVTCEFQQGNPSSAFNLFEHSQNLFRVCVSRAALARPASSMTESLERVLIPFSSRHLLTMAQLGLPSLFHHLDISTMSRTQWREYLQAKPSSSDFASLRSELFTLLCRSHMVVRAGLLTRHLPHEIGRTTPLRDELLSNLHNWHNRIRNLPLARSNDETCMSPTQPISQAYLLAYFHVALVQVSTCHSLTEAIYQNHLDSFQQILNQSSTILSSASSTHRTAFPPFTYGIGPPLYFVATRCRHPILRRTAISLLHQIPPPAIAQSTHWSLFPITQIAEAVVSFEEKEGLCSQSPHPPPTHFASAPATPTFSSSPPEHRQIHHIQLITRPRPPSHGGGKRELALRFTTYDERFKMKSSVWDLRGDVAWGL